MKTVNLDAAIKASGELEALKEIKDITLQNRNISPSESLLLTMWNRPQALRWIGSADYDGRKQNVVAFSDSDGAQISLLRANDGRLSSEREDFV